MSADVGRRAQEEALEDTLRALEREITDGEEALYDLGRRFQDAQEAAYGLAVTREALTGELRQGFGHYQGTFHEVKREADGLLDRAREERELLQRELVVLRDAR